MRNTPVKSCPKCNNKVHARKSSCPCGYSFYTTKAERQKIDNWKNLKPGDKIKSIKNNGPYWENPETKEKSYIGSYGEFVVEDVGPNYITCYEIGKVRNVKGRIVNCSEMHTLYMGLFQKSDLCDNLYRCPHKIIRVLSKKERVK